MSVDRATDLSDIEADTIDVWRVERERDGVGPYQVYEPVLNHMSTRHGSLHTAEGLKHPGPHGDRLLRHVFPDRDLFPQSFSFGFKSLDELAGWFDGYMGDLTACGFVARRYRVPASDVILGAAQLVFDKTAATLIETLALSPEGIEATA